MHQSAAFPAVQHTSGEKDIIITNVCAGLEIFRHRKAMCYYWARQIQERPIMLGTRREKTGSKVGHEAKRKPGSL